MINYSESVYEEGFNAAHGNEINYVNWILSRLMVRILFVKMLLSTAQFKKGYNLVWGEKGVDPLNVKNYLLFRVEEIKAFNGYYVYSLDSRKGYEI